MADYHFSVTQIKRSAGQSAIAAAAYRAGEKLHSEYYGEDSDYTRKKGIIETGILLPANAPKNFADREFLWNAVEKAEKHPKAQLAYSFDFSLQNEFSIEENILIAKEYIQRNFVNKGMIADYAIHLPDKADGGVPNPHVHVMCPIRPLNSDGSWGAKQRREYCLDENGNRICGEEGKELFMAVPTTDWGRPETLERWRAAWAEINNAHFAEHNIPVRIDNRSFEHQEILQIPTIHEGPNVRQMERRGIRTEKGERNRWIRQINKTVRAIRERLKALVSWITELKESPEPMVIDLLNEYYDQRNSKAWSNTAKSNNLKEYARLVSYLQEHKIYTVSDLTEHIQKVNKKGKPAQAEFSNLRDRLCELDDIEKAGARYTASKPVYDEWYKIYFKKAKEKFAAEHKKEISTFHVSRKKLTKLDYLDDSGNFDEKKLHREREKMLTELAGFEKEHQPLKEQVETLTAIRKALSQVSDADSYSLSEEYEDEQKKIQEQNNNTAPKKKYKRDDYSL